MLSGDGGRGLENSRSFQESISKKTGRGEKALLGNSVFVYAGTLYRPSVMCMRISAYHKKTYTSRYF